MLKQPLTRRWEDGATSDSSERQSKSRTSNSPKGSQYQSFTITGRTQAWLRWRKRRVSNPCYFEDSSVPTDVWCKDVFRLSSVIFHNQRCNKKWSNWPPPQPSTPYRAIACLFLLADRYHSKFLLLFKILQLQRQISYETFMKPYIYRILEGKLRSDVNFLLSVWWSTVCGVAIACRKATGVWGGQHEASDPVSSVREAFPSTMCESRLSRSPWRGARGVLTTRSMPTLQHDWSKFIQGGVCVHTYHI